jgi:A/G-specific adenine glycosylase
MLALPTSDWRPAALSDEEARAAAPMASDWRDMGEIEHVFTHFALTLRVWRAEVSGDVAGVIWAPADQASHGLPSVFLKALRTATIRLL